ncbi:tRNA pseudouridine(38-40) synthase TruA [Parachlamydia sp. AcF125]|uniref:tRNA pseudouridine(38-40) synthase TruA n=1 Tax=Parachlamydia sp. AcF125 TaxID=2795736 RepID=UPI001BCA5269|nr:tRNA pseudouridine(38-40) synthase TruA [Parachlamydia sp. AcF125]MBS4168747.1 tRNA pseudouridine synthase A [Parachlamydia sp. AcF125]
MINIRLTISYDGGRFLGWQKTSIGPSIEESLENALRQILQETIALQAASRTDAGVHAHEQVVNFFTAKSLDLRRLSKSLNGLLPKDIVVLDAQLAPHNFHPTLDCLSKEYRYSISTGPIQSPDRRFYAWHCPGFLDKELMQKAAMHLAGVHDFSAFCNFKKNEGYTHYVREVSSIQICETSSDDFYFQVIGKSFLYKMVRNIVGTLIYVGKGKLQCDDLPLLLKGGDRTKIGMTAPAHGLTLYRLSYSN